MKTIRLMAAAAAALLLAGACTEEAEMTTAVTEDEGVTYMFEGQEDGPCQTYSYSFEYITGGVPEAVKEKINGLIVRGYIASDITTTDVAEACKIWKENVTSGYEAEMEECMEDYDPECSFMYTWERTLSGEFTTRCDARNWQTYLGGGSDYLGGAHPYSYGAYSVFDMKTGEEIKEEDFLDIENSDLYDLFFARIMDEGNFGDEEDLLDVPTFNNNFAVDNEGVTWLFNPYEIAAYAYGPIEATLTWEELKPYLLNK